MIHKLDEGAYFEFRDEHLIYAAVTEKQVIDRTQNQVQIQNRDQISFREIEQFGRLNLRLKSVRDVVPEFEKNGLIARFVIPVPKDRVTPVAPYQEPDAFGDGYGSDPKTVIASAILDLNAGNYETFMEKIFPPATILIMKTDGRWNGLMSSLKPDAPLVAKMIEDLNLMTSIEPAIEGNTATYRLPNRIPKQNAETIPDANNVKEDFNVNGNRVIRLSMIGKSWRFFDSSSSTLNEQQSAYSRPSVEATNNSAIVLEKTNGQWKLRL